MSENTSKNLSSTILIILLTAILVGGGVYYWQQSTLQPATETNEESETASLEEQVENLEDEIEDLQDSLEEATSENEGNEESEEATDIETYTNSGLGFTIAQPAGVGIDVEMNDEYNRLVVFEGEDLKYEVRLKSSEGWDGVESYHYLDFPSVGETTVAGQKTAVFESEKGYCDGPGCGDPFKAYVLEQGDDFYTIVFYGDTTLSQTEQAILDSFEFTS